MNIRIKQTDLTLLPERILYLQKFGVLCLADWHLGKAAHFRKSGIPVPQPDLDREFDLVGELIKRYDAKAVVFLGDLFHSYKNNDWEQFATFIRRFPGVAFTLIRGNHDVIPEEFFTALGIHWERLLMLGQDLILTHEPLYEETPEGLLNIAGHIHPGYRVQLKARQGIVLPCYHYSGASLVLPAFGGLTGLQPLPKKTGHVFYCVLGDEVVAV